MDSQEYKEGIITRLDNVQCIYNNCIAQQQAVEANNVELLGKLIEEQQKNINKLVKLSEYCSSHESFKSTSEIEIEENRINSLLSNIINTSKINITNAEKLRDKIGNSIYSLKINRRALMSGYYKKSGQLYGYFIDKKIGR